MIGNKGRPPAPDGRLIVAVAAVLSVAAACGSDGGSARPSGGELPATVKVVSIERRDRPRRLRGPVRRNKGYDLAIKEINDQEFLGGTKLDAH